MRAADESAFEQFMASRSGDLLRLAVLLAADRGHAEDLVQTALVKAYRRWGRISGEDRGCHRGRGTHRPDRDRVTPAEGEPASVVALRQLAAEAADRRFRARRSAGAHRAPVQPQAHHGEHDAEEDLRHGDAVLPAGEPRR
jgi:hypothetical protein